MFFNHSVEACFYCISLVTPKTPVDVKWKVIIINLSTRHIGKPIRHGNYTIADRFDPRISISSRLL